MSRKLKVWAFLSHKFLVWANLSLEKLNWVCLSLLKNERAEMILFKQFGANMNFEKLNGADLSIIPFSKDIFLSFSSNPAVLEFGKTPDPTWFLEWKTKTTHVIVPNTGIDEPETTS